MKELSDAQRQRVLETLVSTAQNSSRHGDRRQLRVGAIACLNLGGGVPRNAVQSLRGQCSENPFARWRSDSDARRCLGGFGGLSDFLRGQ